MEYQKIINLLENTPNQPSKFKINKLVEINNDSRGTNNTGSQIRFKTTMLKSSLCDYSYAYKQIMVQKYQTLKNNILLLLIIINSRIIYMMKR